MSANRLARIALALGSLRRSGVRSLLALGAVSVGVASMMIMLAINAGARIELERADAQAARDLLTITAGRVRALPGRGRGWFTSTRLSFDDATAVSALDGVRAVAPMIESAQQVRFDDTTVTASVRGVPPPYYAFRDFSIGRGRYTDELDGIAASRVAVVGAFVARRLGRGQDLVGDTIRIGNVPFEVIGQLEPKGAGEGGANEDNVILIPLETAARRLFNVDYLSAFFVQAADRDLLAEIRNAARELLRRSHKLDADTPDDFEMLSAIRAAETGRSQSAFMQGLGRILAATTLAVGAVGVLVVTYLNVVDRTWEVGLRMAIGARRRDIAALFLVEASALSVLGGLLGMLVGYIAIAALRRATEWPTAVDLRAMVWPLLASLALGIVFGAGPAMRASRLMPVQALGSA